MLTAATKEGGIMNWLIETMLSSESVVLSLTRHLLTMGAGILVTRGIIKDDLASQLIAVGIALATALWAKYAKGNAKAVSADAVAKASADIPLQPPKGATDLP
jgi:hypothetical protein